MFTKYFTDNTKQKTNLKPSQDNKSATVQQQLETWKFEINWNNCFLQWWKGYRYYGYSHQNHFPRSTIASLNQSLHFRLMWYHEILDLQWIFALQLRKFWQNLPLACPNTKVCIIWQHGVAFQACKVYSYQKGNWHLRLGIQSKLSWC